MGCSLGCCLQRHELADLLRQLRNPPILSVHPLSLYRGELWGFLWGVGWGALDDALGFPAKRLRHEVGLRHAGAFGGLVDERPELRTESITFESQRRPLIFPLFGVSVGLSMGFLVGCESTRPAPHESG